MHPLLQARDHLRRVNRSPRRVPSYSKFGSRDGATFIKMRQVYETLKDVAPDLVVDGEMQGDLAVNESLRERYVVIKMAAIASSEAVGD